MSKSFEAFEDEKKRSPMERASSLGSSLAKGSLDLAFLVDATKSMDDWLRKVKDEIENIVQECRDKLNVTHMRVGFVAYRDWGDEKRIEKLDFTDDLPVFKDRVGKLVAEGGLDAAEDVMGGLEAAVNLPWEADVRVMYHILDAPPHGTQYHDLLGVYEADKKQFAERMRAVIMDCADMSTEEIIEFMEDELLQELGSPDELDRWPEGHPDDLRHGRTHESMLNAMKEKNIQCFIARKTEYVDQMIDVFKGYGEKIGHSVESMDTPDVAQFFPTVVHAVSQAIRLVSVSEDVRKKRQALKKVRLQEFLALHNFQVHVGIDFGTSGTSFAVAMKDKKGGIKVTRCTWPGAKADVKTKTSILFDARQRFLAFGNEAHQQYIHEADEDDRRLYFEHFKMALYEAARGDEDRKTDIQERIRAANGRLMNSDKVLCEALRHVKEKALESMHKVLGLTLLSPEAIQWVLTVPAIWSNRAKYIMKQAARRAGLITGVKNQLIIAYEPVCAAITILSELADLGKPEEKESKSVRNKPAVAASGRHAYFLTPGKRYILCDLGGGTADIACHEVVSAHATKEVRAPSGGPWGSEMVNHNFQKLFEDMLGEEAIEELRTQFSVAFVSIHENFEAAKVMIQRSTFVGATAPTNAFVEYVAKPCEQNMKEAADGTTPKRWHQLQLPFDVAEFIEEQELIDKINNYEYCGHKGLIEYREGEEYLYLEVSVWRHLMDAVIDPIVAHCQELLAQEEMRDGRCEFMCLAGGFSSSPYLTQRLSAEFGRNSKYHLKMIKPRLPLLAVVEGAARFGLCPDFVISRTLSKTYGVAVAQPKADVPFDVPPERLSSDKKLVEGLFHAFVRKGDRIRLDEPVSPEYFQPIDARSNQVLLRLFESDEPNPRFVSSSPLAEKLVELPAEFLDKYRVETGDTDIPILFFFGDTTIRVFIDLPGLPDDQKEIMLSYQYEADS